jgi:hypothetical protein
MVKKLPKSKIKHDVCAIPALVFKTNTCLQKNWPWLFGTSIKVQRKMQLFQANYLFEA